MPTEERLRELEERVSALERAMIRLQAGSDPEWLDIDGAADYLGVSVRTMRRYLASGRLKARRVGGRQLRFRSEDLDAFLEPA